MRSRVASGDRAPESVSLALRHHERCSRTLRGCSWPTRPSVKSNPLKEASSDTGLDVDLAGTRSAYAHKAKELTVCRCAEAQLGVDLTSSWDSLSGAGDEE